MRLEKKWVLALVVGALAAGGAAYAASAWNAPVRNQAVAGACVDDEDDGVEEKIALADVPADVLGAAKTAVEGIAFTAAEKEVEGGVTLYELVGTANGKTYEVEVSAAGEVLEIEEGEDDDDD